MNKTLLYLLATLILAGTPPAQAVSGSAKIFNVTVNTRSAVSTLSGLTLSSGTLSPSFALATTSYAASVTNATTSMTVTPTVTDTAATIKVNGTTVTSGTASGAITLAVGTNAITTVVTAQDGVTTSTYTITVTRAPSAIATLSGLALNSGTLSPAFTAATLSYTATVPNATTSITIAPTATDATATIKVDGTTVASGAASGAIALAIGTNTITTVVTAQDGTTIKTYTVTVTRISNVSTLASLTLSSGTLSPAFASATPYYTASVPNATTSVTITPVLTDSTATIKVNGTTVASGAASGAIALAVGANTITTVVTAQDGTTTNTYTVAMTRAADPVVSNISAVQRAGSQLVDITYDVTADTPTIPVWLAISSDGGATYSVPTSSLSGAIGAGVAIGTGKVITWNPAADYNKPSYYYSTTTRFKVTAGAPGIGGFSLIPSGSFQMGNAMAADTDITDAPIRTVTVSNFYMAQNLVTWADWGTIRTWGLTHGYWDLAVGAGKASNHPVQRITWYDMVKWCNARSEMEGLTPCYTLSGAVYRTTSNNAVVCNWAANGYRLPSEAEWEKAARGGLSGKRFPWGDTISQSQANYSAATGSYSYDLGPNGYNSIGSIGGTNPATSPVGSFAANGYGIYDMVGNLDVWCWDWLGTYAAGAQTDPRGASSGTVRVLRGGNWCFGVNLCRVASRGSGYPTGPGNPYIGFRVARSLVQGGPGFAITSNVTVDTRSTVATLSGLVLNSGALSPAFATATPSYTASVPTTSITVTPTVTDSTATIQVNGTTVVSGAASQSIPLVEGANTINVVGTAQDGTTLSIYTVTVTPNFTYSSALDVPASASSYIATGNIANLSLGFAPTTGTNLTLINNTGLSFITGRFSNLAQGQMVPMSYNDVTYQYIANYYGGTGNDLILQWPHAQAYAWGMNSNGQLGNSGGVSNMIPGAVSTAGILAGKAVTSMAAGAAHSLALCMDGTVVAWGCNDSGQLGNGGSLAGSVPVAVSTTGVLSGKTVIALAAGDSHSLALCSDGSMAAWGDNYNGQLGNNSTTGSNVPVAVNTSGVLAGKTVVAIAVGAFHSLALCSDGKLVSWGYNADGELGNSSALNRSVPVLVTATGALSGKTVVAIAAGYYHSLALCSDGTLATWGFNGSGQLGNNTANSASSPVVVSATAALIGKTIASIAAGGSHSLTLCTDGTLEAWGDNGYGQLGRGNNTGSRVPVTVYAGGALAGQTVSQISAGYGHSLALCADGTLVAWGYNQDGELGNNSTINMRVPTTVPLSPLGSGTRILALAQGPTANHALATVAIPLSNNPALSGLGLSAGSLSPAFATSTTSYTASVPGSTASLTLTPVTADAYATVKVNGTAVASGSASQAIALAAGENTINVAVTAESGLVTSTYAVTVFRPSWISTLSALALSEGMLSPAFATGTAAYTANVPDTTSSITVTPTLTDTTASVKVNGTTVASGSASGAISLGSSAVNTLTVVVTAQDGNTTTYTVIIDNTPFGIWQKSTFTDPANLADPEVSGDLATPAHDGITNLMKYALALDPMVCGTAGLPATSRQAGYLTLTYRKNKTATDVTYTVLAGDDLGGDGWSPATTVVTQTDPTPGGGSFWLVTVRDNVPHAGQARRFMRLQVAR